MRIATAAAFNAFESDLRGLRSGASCRFMTPRMMDVCPDVCPVGPELRAARLNAGLTIEQLAVRAGIGGATVERIEHGKVTPHRSTLLALAIALER